MSDRKRQKNKRRISLQEIKKSNRFYIPNVNAYNTLNNIYYVTELAKSSLVEIRTNLIASNDYHIKIDFPDATGKLKKSKKRKSRTVKVLKNAIRYDLYANSLISAVAATEGFIERVVRISLLIDPRRLAHPIKKQSKKAKLSLPEIEVKIDDTSVPLRSVLDANSIESVYEVIINDKLMKLMYASPNDYFGYLKNALDIDISDNLVSQYIEIKATRDLLTHNQGYINDVYFYKVGDDARATKTNQRIPLPSEYFGSSIGIMKKIVTAIYQEASKVYLGVIDQKQLYPKKTKYS